MLSVNENKITNKDLEMKLKEKCPKEILKLKQEQQTFHKPYEE